MHMVFVFWIVDSFFCMGPKVLFPVGCVTSFFVRFIVLMAFL